ncbi:hypothetical protein [Streptomyces mirabilis]|uniref:hypothetical protein n=1 Tax=Streptomyces mirabilis TaxID=68239 RepID=UPI00167CFC8A|nr:hypothetical protein [Streptomyces mirabilis]
MPAEAGGDVDAALAAALAPFDMDSDNPVDRGMWDSWTIRGGSDGHGFAVGAGHWNDPRLIHDMPRWDGTPLPSVPGVCAGGPRGLLDFTRPTAAAERTLGASWDLWQELSAAHPPAVPLADFVHRWRTDPEAFPGDQYGEAMFAAYREQAPIQAYLDHPFSLGRGWLSFPEPSEHPVIAFEGGRADYLRPAADMKLWHRDVLTPDGWWIEPDGHAVHGACDPDDCPHTAPTIGPKTELYLASLPEDTLLIRLHCHC